MRDVLQKKSGPKRVLVSGASGLVGGALVSLLKNQGRAVRPLVRRRSQAGPDASVYWSPETGEIDRVGLAWAEAVVHLAGESIADGRWTPKRKRRIVESRVKGTGLLARALAESMTAGEGAQVFVSTSAVGWYGDVGPEPVDESAPAGEGFLADVCRQWEAAARPAVEAGLRVAHPRIGMVLARRGGALAKMLPAFKFGLGGRLGSGSQGVSWIALTDLVRALAFVLDTDAISGPFNAVAPGALSSSAFARELGRALGRPAVLPAPAALLKLALGEMADELLLSGVYALPGKLLQAGFRFQAPTLAEALALELNA